MKKYDVVQAILKDKLSFLPQESAEAFAPTNIALCKYWGKRNQELNLPVTPSLSISLGNKGAKAILKTSDHDSIMLNQKKVELSSSFANRLLEFLGLFRKDNKPCLEIMIESNIPIAAGMASSACGFASIVKALDSLFQWNLTSESLSILARLGSGSACRSLWQGFVEWHEGVREDGMDSYAESITEQWPELCVGILILSDQEKSLSSREAMRRTVETSALYAAWPQKVAHDLLGIKEAIYSRDFEKLGKSAESNALAMHATMLSAWPPVNYCLPSTLTAMQQIWKLREAGCSVYFTQDAGPNLKLLFLKKNKEILSKEFSNLDVLQPFEMC